MNSARRERKVVTVLFADLVGFTSRAESLDPEDVEAILRPYHQRLRDELERHGGTVEKFIGDAVMALFGAPTAHEDDPERAVRAALAIREWAREEGELEVRIGITTGEALVSLGARPEAGEGMAAGDVVNTASRLQAAAQANGILVDQTTHRATQQAIDYREAVRVKAKGKAEPIPVWEAIEARARFGVDVVQRLATPLIGRRQELDILAGALARVREDRSPQLVTLVGIPGIGKSRLVYELFQLVERDPDLIYWRQGRSLSYGEGVSYWALAEMVKAQAGILETDAAEKVREKLVSAVSDVVEDPADAEWIQGHLRPLVGLGGGHDASAERQAEAASAWRRFIEALADEHPLVLVFEDLHWADDGLLDFVDYVAEWATEVPLLLVCTARPELLARRPGWGGGKPNAVTLSLSPLSDRETAELVSALLEQTVPPAEVQTVLLERAEGNPLYAEEYVRMLQDRGLLRRRERGWELDRTADFPLPESVQGMIAGRLDALPPEQKLLVQDAAVVGKVFWAGALQALNGFSTWQVEERLHALVRRELVRRERRSTLAGETQYAFLHLLMRDVAYSQIPRAQRAEKHRRAAEWIESLGRPEDQSELLAHHYLAVLELAEAAGIDRSEIAGRARAAFSEAGDRALALNALPAASRFYSAALELVDSDEPDWPYLVLRQQRARSHSGVEDLAALARAVEALISMEDAEAAAEGEALIADVLHGRGDVRTAGVHLDRALALIADSPASRAKAAVLAQRARFSMLASRGDATARGREALALAEQLGLDELRASLLNTIGSVRVSEGDLGGVENLKQSLALALELKSPGEIHRSYNNLMEAYRRMGNWPEASRTLAENRAANERFGFPARLQGLRDEEAHDAYYTGNWDEAIAAADEVIADAETGQGSYLEPIARTVRAKVRFARGDERGAGDDTARAVQLAVDSDPQVVSTVLGSRALLLLEGGARAESALVVDEILAIPAYIYAVVDVAFVLRALDRGAEAGPWLSRIGRLPWAAVGEAIAADDLDRAAELLRGMGNVADDAYVRLRSGREAEVRRALEFYRSVGATRYLAEGEAVLARTA